MIINCSDTSRLKLKLELRKEMLIEAREKKEHAELELYTLKL
jgi:hypothetical protein